MDILLEFRPGRCFDERELDFTLQHSSRKSASSYGRARTTHHQHGTALGLLWC
jgi:hypothetical protein